jgi:hypothetical protein
MKITDEQVKTVLQMYWHYDDPSKTFSVCDKQDMRRALEAAFPSEPNQPTPQKDGYRIFTDGNMWCAVGHDFINIQESKCAFDHTPEGALSILIHHGKLQQPAVFTKLVVTEEMAFNFRQEAEKDMSISTKQLLQSFVDRHSIQMKQAYQKFVPTGSVVWDSKRKIWMSMNDVEQEQPDWKTRYTHWLPASALPVPEPVVDAKEEAKEKAWDQWKHNLSRSHFDQIWFLAQKAGGKE